MDPNTPSSPLAPSAVDPEVFRRVWNRVMPDQKDCPIVPTIHRPRTQPPSSLDFSSPSPDPVHLIQVRMEQLQPGLLQARHLIRRHGNQPVLLRLWNERQQAMRRLSTACFLAIGRRIQPSGQAPIPSSALHSALREQFLWEQQWAQDCLLTSGDVSDPALKELFHTLSRQSRSRANDIRIRLERM